ncbi:MAG: HAD family phosphatase [Anaerolineales bacterium]|nr:HAD family phosphatase [Anaerolineales bacterium]
MIRAMIFDLDGTLVQTEKLKALSYAKAVVELCPDETTEGQVLEAFKDVVGLSRREVAQALVEGFNLEKASQARMSEFGVSTPWQAFVQIRMNYYDRMLADPQVLRSHQWVHNRALLEEARRQKCQVGLATMSQCNQAQRVLQILGLADEFDFIATRDDVERGKPDPEIYLLVASELDVPPANCLVIEDSPAGVKAALAAGMHCVAVTTPFTRERIHASQLLDEGLIVDDPSELPEVVRRVMGRE